MKSVCGKFSVYAMRAVALIFFLSALYLCAAWFLRWYPHDFSIQKPLEEVQVSHKTPYATRMPIFAYHLVRPACAADTDAIRQYLVTPDVFDEEMKYLVDNGYHVISFSALEDYLNYGTPLPQKPVIISFDDGWENQYTYAFPILKKYHLTATFFVITGATGQKNHMTWNEVETLAHFGMTIGSHTQTHPYLGLMMSERAIWNEVAGSKQILQSHLGIPVTEFAYPFSSYNPLTILAARRAGYASARTYSNTSLGPQDDLYRLRAIGAPDNLQSFVQILNSAY